jgi:hypothetical protein
MGQHENRKELPWITCKPQEHDPKTGAKTAIDRKTIQQSAVCYRINKHDENSAETNANLPLPVPPNTQNGHTGRTHNLGAATKLLQLFVFLRFVDDARRMVPPLDDAKKNMVKRQQSAKRSRFGKFAQPGTVPRPNPLPWAKCARVECPNGLCSPPSRRSAAPFSRVAPARTHPPRP